MAWSWKVERVWAAWRPWIFWLRSLLWVWRRSFSRWLRRVWQIFWWFVMGLSLAQEGRRAAAGIFFIERHFGFAAGELKHRS